MTIHSLPPAQDHVANVLSRLEHVKSAAGGWVARCPAHDDKVQSLKIDLSNDDARLLLFCHAGCETPDVVDALGLSMSDLFAPKTPPNVVPIRQKIEETYDYTDENGELILQVVRYTPKTFRQRRPDGKGGWIWSLSGIVPPLYRLPELVSADPRSIVFVCAGEKDANRLASLGLVATTNAGGEGKGKWRNEYTELLRGRSVVVVCDNDKTGRSRGDELGRTLSGSARKVRVLSFPMLGDHGDVSDWLDTGKSKADLAELVKSAPEWEDAAIPTEETNPATFHKTETGNGKRLAHYHGDHIRFVPEWGRWIIWNGSSWETDNDIGIMALAKETARNIFVEAAGIDDKDDRKSLISWAFKSESVSALKAMAFSARSEPGIAAPATTLDTNPFLLNVENGTVDLRTGKLMGHDPSQLITQCLSIAYDLDAVAPKWNAFLDRIFNGDRDIISYVKRAIGYAITGSVSEQVVFIMVGNGQNGKSTLVETISSILGGYASTIPTDRLMIRRGDSGVPEDLASLGGKRFVTATETTDGKRIDESMVKSISGGDRMRVRFMRENSFDFYPSFKLFLTSNHKPIIRGTDKGIWRRIRLIPFGVEIPDAERIPDFKSQLLEEESPGILNWMIEGCLEWQEEGLGTPTSVANATSFYQEEMNVFGRFLEETCVADANGSISSTDLYTIYKQWVEDNGEFQMTKTAFGRKMTETGFDRKTNFRGAIGNSYVGIRRRGKLDSTPS